MKFFLKKNCNEKIIMKKGKIIILSGPSGSGKTTISNYLLSKIPELKFSTSCTTRNSRNKEIHGKDKMN